MDFFEHQEQARRTSRRLVGLVILAVLGVLTSLQFLAAGLWVLLDDGGKQTLAEGLLDPRLLLATFGIGGGLILLGTLIKLRALGGGGVSVASAMGGREIAPQTRDLAERRLMNVVEEMALAAGIRVPRVFVLPSEQGLNAFAAGYSPDDAVVAVTGGLLKALNRAELQAVVGHEFSHILNGDMRLNIRLIGILGGMLGLSIAGRVIMELSVRMLRFTPVAGRRNKRDNTAALVFAFLALGLGVWIIGLIGVFFGRMLQSAISRQREYLADASATQFTRDPMALASALKIIGAAPHGARVRAGHAAEVSHMLFASGIAGLFATHPPLVKRIQRIEPGFDGNFVTVRNLLERRMAEAQDSTPDDADDEVEALLKGRGGLASGGLLHHVLRQAEAEGAQTNVTDPGLNWLSQDERAALRNPEAAICCLYGTLLAPAKTELHDRQIASITTTHGSRGADFAEAAQGWQQRQHDWTARQRRMACELAAERLRGQPEEQRKEVLQQVETLSRMDQHIDDFEFALGYLIRRRLLPEPETARLKPLPPAALAGEISFVLSALAHTGATDAHAARAAWESAIAAFTDAATGATLLPGLKLITQGLDDLTALESALERLIRLAPLCKREMLNACLHIIRHDHNITDAEENTLAAIADAIHAYGWQMGV